MKFQKYLFFIISCFSLHASLQSMRSTVTKTNKLSKAISKFFPNVGNYPVQPSIVDFPSYESTNSSKNNQQKKKWYQRKAFKYPMRFAIASPFLDYLMDMYEYQSMLNESDDLAKKDPELYFVAQTIKNDLGITEDINFRIWKQSQDNAAQFKVGSKLKDSPLPKFPCSILISPNYKSKHKSDLIFIIAHELEHARQWFEYTGSYAADDSSQIARTMKREMGADAAASDYQNCYECLQLQIASINNPVLRHNPANTEYGYFTTEKGYFSPKDYDLWIQRAKEDCALCPAHKAGTADNQNTPFKDFLPQTTNLSA